jgi:hypothetical protein
LGRGRAGTRDADGVGWTASVCVYYCVDERVWWWWARWEWWERGGMMQQLGSRSLRCGQRGPFGCHVLWLAATEVLSTDGHRSKVAGVGIIAGLVSDWVSLVGLGGMISISNN